MGFENENQQITILALPSSVLRCVLIFLEPRDLAACCMTCKALDAYARGSAKHILLSLTEKYNWITSTRDRSPVHSPSKKPTSSSGCGNIASRLGSKVVRIDENERDLIEQLDLLTRPRILIIGGNSEPHKVDSMDIEGRWRLWQPTLIGREVFFEVLSYRGFYLVFCGQCYPI